MCAIHHEQTAPENHTTTCQDGVNNRDNFGTGSCVSGETLHKREDLRSNEQHPYEMPYRAVPEPATAALSGAETDFLGLLSCESTQNRASSSVKCACCCNNSTTIRGKLSTF